MGKMRYGIGTFLKGTTRAGIAFSAYAFLTSFDFIAIVPGVSLGRIASFALLLILALDLNKIRLIHKSFLALAFSFLFSSLVVLLLMSSPASGLKGLFSYLLNVTIFASMVSLPLTDEDYELCECALVLSALVMCVLMQTSAGSVGTEWVTERAVVNIAGSQQDPNQFCGYFLFAISFCAYFALTKRRIWLFLVVAFCFYSVLLTGSRGGLVAAALSLVLSLCFGLDESKHKTIYIAAMILVFVLAAICFDDILGLLPSSVASRFSEVSLSDGSASTRIRAWKEILEAYASSDLLRQLFGHGYGATIAVTFNGLVAHNTYLEVLYSFGLLGLISYVSLQGICCFRALRTRNYQLLAAICAHSALLFSITDSSSRILWVLLTLSVVSAGKRQYGCDERRGISG